MKRYVLCLKHGNKYDHRYVNNLHSMVSRHLTVDYEFVCLTEDPNGLNKNIRVIPLDTKGDISGWWYKPTIFNPSLGLEGTILFLDLDVIIFNNIDMLFSYEPDKFCIIDDFYAKRKKSHGMNSSCFRFIGGSNSNVYYEFVKNSQDIMRTMHGDQDWMQKVITENYSYWPHSWIKSYKWEMHREADITKRGDRYIVNGEPIIDKDSSIAVFHGNPKPDQIDHKWCIENWR